MKGAIHTAADLRADVEVRCDVCIVGSGAGGAVLAAGLAQRGLSVVILEEGGHHTRSEFDLQEGNAYPMLYQERGGRTTADLSITVLQGRSVGGSTTVNWTTCFRTPARILAHWREHHGVELTEEELGPHWEAVEARLGIQEWPLELMNANNRKLWDGCGALGWSRQLLRRNVRGCVNSGYCGVGCPVDGKQAMHVTYVPDALEAGAVIYANTRADRLEIEGDRVVAVHATVVEPDTDLPRDVRVTVLPKVAVSSGGAINGPALLLRSGLNRNGRVGKRTFLHPVVATMGVYHDEVRAFFGAPQSAASHQFVDRGPGEVGFFMETPPVHPMLAATAVPVFGARMHEFMSQLAHIGSTIALSVDGLLQGDEGGTVSLREDGRPRLDYPVRAPLVESMRAAHEALARVQLASGALRVYSLHADPVELTSEADLPKLAAAPYGALQHKIFTAHQMGGCAMGKDPERSVVDGNLRHHHVPNLFVVDGSVFPTSLGVNPSESIYGLAHRAVQHVGSAV